MPIYEYYCAHCDAVYDRLQKVDAEPLTICATCQQTGLQKKISAPGFKLTGTGWYETDFKSKPKNTNIGDNHSVVPESTTETKN